MKPFFLSVLLTLSFLFGQAQENATRDFSDKINQYDLSVVWMADSIDCWEEEKGIFEHTRRPATLGFIGNDYQRFYIKLISAVKVPDKANEYMLYGKTRVKNTICNFIGTAKIIDAKLYPVKDKSNYTRGVATVDFAIYEDVKQASTGVIKGRLLSNFMIDKKGVLQYDGFYFYGDGFNNNQFTGTWTNYKTGKVKKCHFGDWRIPDCGDLDIGAGEFSVNEKYVKNGWESYVNLMTSSHHSPLGQIAKEEENRQWWKD